MRSCARCLVEKFGTGNQSAGALLSSSLSSGDSATKDVETEKRTLKNGQLTLS